MTADDRKRITADLLIRLDGVRAVMADDILPPAFLVPRLASGICTVMFGSLSPLQYDPPSTAAAVCDDIISLLSDFLNSCYGDKEGDRIAEGFFSHFPTLMTELMSDAQAIYEGDPAARSISEIIISYPGFLAIALYRIAHTLHTYGVAYLPRMITEYGHRLTGIDIHPAATVGSRFCIDHGTGIVIGETACIGDGVKLYQGVTLGAKSFARDADGRLVKGGKRHPTVGDGCIIYAGATVLGGDTVIGSGSVIGGNVWLTHSVPAGSRIYYKEG